MNKNGNIYPGKVRIIGGRWRSRKLHVADNTALRPTPNRVRETLFNWLQPYIEGAVCIDLFAGTGALCFEALSRGAGHVTMVENDAASVAALRQTQQTLSADHASIVQADGLSYLQQSDQAFDIIFVDPPFESDYIKKCLDLLANSDHLKRGGLLYTEAPKTADTSTLFTNWKIFRSKTTGQVSYSLLQKSVST